MANTGPDFRDAMLAWAPWYMRAFWGGRLLEAVGMLLNGLADRVDEGRRAASPLLCQEDALPYFSRDRSIELYQTEPIVSRRYRLSRWWQLHAKRGTALGIMEHLQPYFLGQPALPKIRVVSQNQGETRAQWWTRNADGTVERHVASPSNWNWDSTAEKATIPGGRHWARAWVIVYTEGTYLDLSGARYDDGTLYDDGVTVYDGITAQARSDLIRMVKLWRSAHEQIWGIALAHDPASFDPTATAITLGDGSTTLPTGSPSWLHAIDASNNPTRLNTADWIYDRTVDGP
jgi:hypothetical protein